VKSMIARAGKSTILQNRYRIGRGRINISDQHKCKLQQPEIGCLAYA
jgi:hypothetical protein